MAGPAGVELLDLAEVSAHTAISRLGGTPGGLTEDEAEARLRSWGPNLLPEAHGPGLVRQFVDQLVHFFAVMLWVAAVLAFVGGMPQLGWAIVAVVIVNAAFSFVQEFRAERATRALAALLPATATVLRDGRRHPIPAEALVPGDLVLLREGDLISADARLIRSDGLAVDNSTLTGESEPLQRRSDALSSRPRDVVDAANLVFAGTYVTSGSGVAAAVATGAATRLGSISRLTGEIRRRPTPLRLQMNRAVRVIAMFAVGAGAIFFVASSTLQMPARDGFLFAVGVIVALVPEGLLPTLSLSLAMSAARMARRGALVRHLESVETLGSTTVICSDKTGTITANQMTARAIAVGGWRVDVSGAGYEPAGTLLDAGRPLAPEELLAVEPLLRAAALCNDARLEPRDGRWRCVGDPTEGALLVLARKGGLDRETVERVAPRLREYPFESRRRRMSTVHVLPSGEIQVLTKGSPEAVLDACALDRSGREAALKETDRLAHSGLRVLAFARRTLAGDAPPDAVSAEQGLELLGFVGLEDPVRPEVPEALRRCRQAGIRVLMLTGDHPATAATVARKAGFGAGRVVLGSELPEDRAGLERLLSSGVSVIARVAPEQKLRIAEALQGLGEVVAMTGDGVNDAPVLRRADIGVAMGVVGTDVAREAADLVLLDDNFAHIVEAVEEGRAAHDNIRRFLTYHLTDNVAELAPFAMWALSAGRIPLMLSVLQILALDIGTDLLPALALGAEAPEPGVMGRPPGSRRARLLDRRVLGRAFGFLGPVEAVISLSLLPLGAAVLFGWRFGEGLPAGPEQLATLSTMVFSAIVLRQMANALECRSTPASLFSLGTLSNRLLLGAVAAEAVALLGFVYLGPVRALLGHRALGAAAWLMLLPAPLFLLGAEEGRKLLARRVGGRARSRRGVRPSRPAKETGSMGA